MWEQEAKYDLRKAWQKCKDTKQSSFAPKCAWQQHPTRPIKFFVMDQQKIRDADKLVWLRQELEDDAPLEEFAAKFVELFEDKVHNQATQKSVCLKLYSLYNRVGLTWKKESDLFPKQLVAFQRVWEPEAPDRCAECGKPLEKPGQFCNSTCEHAGTKNTCQGCGADLDPVHPYCRTCKRGASPLRHTNNKRSVDQMSMAQRMWFGGAITKDPTHEPAWKSRRRS